MSNREKQIENFLSKWNEMVKASKEVDGFEWKFEVAISSSDSLILDRIKTIDGINESFRSNNMRYESQYDIR